MAPPSRGSGRRAARFEAARLAGSGHVRAEGLPGLGLGLGQGLGLGLGLGLG